jgi:hypothetical protein
MADDLGKGARGTGGAAGRDDAKPAAPASPPGAVKPDILAGLDAFSRKLDEEQKAHERAEAEQRRRREEDEARRRMEAERVRQAQAEALRKVEAEKQGEGRRFSALEMLRKQAATRPVDDTARRRALAKPLLNKSLLSTLHFLAEFAKETNAVFPTTEGSYGFIYLEQGPPMVLSKAFADYRARKLDGDEVCDHVFLLYQARYAQPVAVDVSGPDIEHCRRFLAMSRVPFEFNATRKNDFGEPVSGTFTLSGPIPCELYVRADYDAPGVVIELLNVGRLGAGRCFVAPETFNERFVDEIGKHALGSKNEFARLVTR